MSTVKLTSGAASITLIGPVSVAQPAPALLGVVTGLTANMTRYSYRKSANVLQRWQLTWQTITSDDKRRFEKFIYEVLKGPAQRFQYEHTDGRVYNNVRIAETEIPWTREGANQWAVTLTFEIDARVSGQSDATAEGNFWIR